MNGNMNGGVGPLGAGNRGAQGGGNNQPQNQSFNNKPVGGNAGAGGAPANSLFGDGAAHPLANGKK
jgi:hypothetical protein